MISEDFKDKVQVSNYLVSKFGGEGVEIIKAIKLLFLADVYALRNHGVSITKDDYFALGNGPVSSKIDNIIENNNSWLESDELPYVNEFLDRRDGVGNTWDKVVSIKEPDEDYLSDLDKEVIDLIFDDYKDRTCKELIDITHKFNAWKKHENDLNNGANRKKMELKDVFENDGELTVPDDVLAGSKVLYAG